MGCRYHLMPPVVTKTLEKSKTREESVSQNKDRAIVYGHHLQIRILELHAKYVYAYTRPSMLKDSMLIKRVKRQGKSRVKTVESYPIVPGLYCLLQMRYPKRKQQKTSYKKKLSSPEKMAADAEVPLAEWPKMRGGMGQPLDSAEGQSDTRCVSGEGKACAPHGKHNLFVLFFKLKNSLNNLQ